MIQIQWFLISCTTLSQQIEIAVCGASPCPNTPKSARVAWHVHGIESIANGCLQSSAPETLKPLEAGSFRYGGFLKWGYPQIIHFRLGFSLINHAFWGTPMTMETPIQFKTVLKQEANVSRICQGLEETHSPTFFANHCPGSNLRLQMA